VHISLRHYTPRRPTNVLRPGVPSQTISLILEYGVCWPPECAEPSWSLPWPSRENAGPWELYRQQAFRKGPLLPRPWRWRAIFFVTRNSVEFITAKWRTTATVAKVAASYERSRRAQREEDLRGCDFLRCINHDKVTRKSHTAELIEKVRLQLDTHFFFENVIGKPYVMRNYKWYSFITRLNSYKLKN
jgi:hypothetical protein